MSEEATDISLKQQAKEHRRGWVCEVINYLHMDKEVVEIVVGCCLIARELLDDVEVVAVMLTGESDVPGKH